MLSATMAVLPVLLPLALLGAVAFIDLWGGAVIVLSGLLAADRCSVAMATWTTLSILGNAGVALWCWWERSLGWHRAGVLVAHALLILVFGWCCLAAILPRSVPGGHPLTEPRPWTRGPLGWTFIVAGYAVAAASDGALLWLLLRR